MRLPLKLVFSALCNLSSIFQAVTVPVQIFSLSRRHEALPLIGLQRGQIEAKLGEAVQGVVLSRGNMHKRR